MSNAIPPRPRFVSGKRSFVIVASQFNAQYVQGLVSHASDEVRRLVPGARITLHQVPGAFEIPVVVREVAIEKKTDAIIALGLILKGQTDHGENLSRSVTDALQRIAVEHGIPVLNGVLSVENETQAHERCLGEKINRGTEAGRAAVEIAVLMGDLRA
jgi:6,7-dimethyl-8-ribityllumazine synthase